MHEQKWVHMEGFSAEIHDEIWVLPKAGPFQHKHVIVGSAIYVCQLSTFVWVKYKVDAAEICKHLGFSRTLAAGAGNGAAISAARAAGRCADVWRTPGVAWRRTDWLVLLVTF